MRNKLINTVFCIFIVGVSAKGQLLDSNEPDFKGNIKSIIEKSAGDSHWWREFDFDSDYRLKEKRYFGTQSSEWLKTEKWDYTDNDSILIIHKQTDDGTRVGAPVHTSYRVEKLYFDLVKRLQRKESFSPDDTTRITIFTNFVYNGNDILRYEVLSVYNIDTLSVQLFEFEYADNNQTVIIKKTATYDSFTRTLKYDKKGNLNSVIVDYNNPEVVLGGAYVWSRKRRDKYRIDYKYDKKGNWIVKYGVTSRRKYKMSVRIIEYD